MTGPLVSVVIPAFNAASFLAEALEGLLAQDYDSTELIVVDDGSTDGTGDVADRFGVTVIRQTNRGPAAARNAALSVARGEFVAMNDADDISPPSRLSTQVGYLLDHPEVACVMGRQVWIDPPPWLSRDRVTGDLGGVPPGTAVFRASVLRELGGYDESFRTGEDMDLLIRLRAAGYDYTVLESDVLYRRFHGENLSVKPVLPANRMRSLKAKLDRERARGASG